MLKAEQGAPPEVDSSFLELDGHAQSGESCPDDTHAHLLRVLVTRN